MEAMKEINPKVPQHIEDPVLAEALLGHNDQKIHNEQSISEDDDDTDFFSQSQDESLLADVSEQKEVKLITVVVDLLSPPRNQNEG